MTKNQVGYTLEVPERPNGPIVSYLVRRTAVGGITLVAGALAALARAKRPSGKAAALGALAPGAGYVYTRNPGRLAVTIPAFGASLVAWFGSGNILAPPAVWAAAALDARRQAAKGRRPWEGATAVVPLAVAGGLAAGAIARRRAFRAAQQRGRERSAYLADTPRIDPRPVSVEPGELTTEDLATVRSLLDRGLQPIDRFDGFDIVEQFQTAGVRYQLYMNQWALALAQLHHTPSFHGYLSAAQRNVIDKLTLPKVWGYWRWEQVWGNLSLDWDPMVRDNIMLTGYLGTSLGLYESNTGDVRYRAPGSLPFRLGQRVWPYDHDKVAAAVVDNMKRARMTLYPCEPNWVYSGCNMTGLNTLLLSDRLHGTSYDDQIGEQLRRRLREEFVTPDGRITAIRSARLGLTIPMLTSTLADAATATFMHAGDPDLAGRTWAIVRREFVDITGPEPRISLRGWDAIDVGNYRRSDISAYASVMWAAAEMGDAEMYETLKEAADRRFHPIVEKGARWYRDGSTQANSLLAIARFSPPSAYRRAVCTGPGDAVLRGPYLEGASYPDVLVARAATDGDDLRLVIRPGNGGGRRPLGVERLRPGARYEIKGATVPEVTADERGSATVEVDLEDRSEVVFAPAG